MSVNRVVVTGFGAVSPFGLGVQTLQQNMYAGNSAVVNMREQWEKRVTDMNSWVGAPLGTEPDPKSIPRKYRKTMGRTAILAAIAARDALEGSGISEQMLSSGKVGVSFGSSTGSVASTEQFFSEPFEHQTMHNLPSGIFFQIMSHTSAANLAQTFNITGRVISPNAACSSSAQAIGLAYEAIKSGHQDIMLCGGSDELHAMTNVSFDIVQAASYKFNDQPQKTPRPFDSDRDGTVCGEGSGCMILESLQSARARGAQILAEIVGFATFSSGVHMAQADADSIVVCMQAALENARLKPQQIDYINAHATGTVVGDISEAQAIARLFGNDRIPVSSFKGHIGHTLGASGVLEMIVTLKMMEDGRLIPTRNLQDVDPECRGVRHITEPGMLPINTFMKNSFAFGGINTVLIAKRYQDD